ncbi:MAG: DUF4783 domain-containing protein [Ignavibacteriaceae bacterium]
MRREILFFFMLTFFLYTNSYTQDKRFFNKLDSSQKAERTNSAQMIFNDIEAGIAGGDVTRLSRFLGSQTYFSLSNGVSGYYSANQAYYVLEDFFKIYQVVSFRLNNVKAEGDNPYATGEYYYDLKGKRDTAQVYISLKFTGNNWKITQITIN